MINNDRFQKIAYWALMLTIFFVYWLFSTQYTGPAYLSDEIGYLSKAAAFAGYPVDMASSWHGGYSLMLAPAFMVFSDPFVVWQGIMVLNAAMWTCSFMLLFCVLKAFFPKRDFRAIFFAVSISAIYPAWISMSGYAFSTSGFVLVFMLSIFALLKSSADNVWSIAPYSLLVGFLYWVHPTGLAVALASVLAIAGYARHYSRYTVLIVHVLVIVVMVVTYKVGIHLWLSQIMTPENYSALTHYKSMSSVFQSFLRPEFWVAWGVIGFGQLSYLLIATLGICGFAIVEAWQRVMPERFGGDDIKTSAWVNASLAFMVLSFLGIILLGSLSYAVRLAETPIRIDHWIYGRYSEVVLLPLLGVGFLALWRLKYTVTASLIVLVSGLVLFLYTNESNTRNINNLVNIQGFWPQALLPHGNFIFWFIAGVLGIILAGFLKKKLFILLTVPLFVVSIFNQNVWHNNILLNHSKPSGLIGFVSSNFQLGQCIGFDTFELQGALLSQIERRNLYSYYFFNYNIRRMSFEEWLADCDGPFLTYRAADFSNLPEVSVIAKEVSSGLFLLVKSESLADVSMKVPHSDFAGLNVDLSGNNTSLIRGGFSMQASSLVRFLQVGAYKESAIVSDGNNGYLFYGPYYPLKKGDYYIKLEGNFVNLDGAILDVVSGAGNNKHLDVPLSGYFNSAEESILIPFSIASDVNDIEIRLKVSSSTELTFYGYSIIAK